MKVILKPCGRKLIEHYTRDQTFGKISRSLCNFNTHTLNYKNGAISIPKRMQYYHYPVIIFYIDRSSVIDVSNKTKEEIKELQTKLRSHCATSSI